jgi:branched-chain amino acid transport system substrate-binding protein
MHFKVKSTLTVLAAATLLVACGKKEEAAAPAAPAAAPVAVVAPSAIVKIGHNQWPNCPLG